MRSCLLTSNNESWLKTTLWCFMICQLKSVSKIRKIFTGPTHRLLLSIMIVSGIYRSLIEWIKLHLLSTVLLSGFQGSLWNCLQDQFNFHRSRSWQIILIFNTVKCNAEYEICDNFVNQRVVCVTSFKHMRLLKLFLLVNANQCHVLFFVRTFERTVIG